MCACCGQFKLVLVCRPWRPVQLVTKQLWQCELMGHGLTWEAFRKSGESSYLGAGETEPCHNSLWRSESACKSTDAAAASCSLPARNPAACEAV